MKKRSKSYIQVILGIVLILAFAVFGYNLNNKIEEGALANTNNNIISNNEININNSNLKIHYIDVGQGDSAIIEQNRSLYVN